MNDGSVITLRFILKFAHSEYNTENNEKQTLSPFTIAYHLFYSE